MPATVRFAPSPTGYLHVGNIRAALINWLFARRDGGSFILRMDDTDPERSKEKFADAIREDLGWLGLNWDETYKQSERFALYDAAAEKLKKAGRLYPCYETAEELETKRKLLLARKKPPVYDRAALDLSDEEKAAFEAEGRKPHWRFKIDLPAVIEFDDLIRGHAHFDLAALSDPILIRGDGSYLYTLPSVVDDIEMAISHVVRGEDHVTNSAVQIQIFEALGGKAPEFAHFTLLKAADDSGLSKREGTLSIREMRAEGIEPEAILSLLAHIGTSESIHPVWERESLIKGFDFSKFSHSSPKFSLDELKGLNSKIIHKLSYEAAKERLGDKMVGKREWQVIQTNISTLKEVADWHHMIEGPITPKIEDKAFIETAAGLLPEGDLGETSWGEWTTAIKAATGKKGRDLFMPLRQALTGMDHGPEMKLLLPLIGADKARARLKGEAA